MRRRRKGWVARAGRAECVVATRRLFACVQSARLGARGGGRSGKVVLKIIFDLGMSFSKRAFKGLTKRDYRDDEIFLLYPSSYGHSSVSLGLVVYHGDQ